MAVTNPPASEGSPTNPPASEGPPTKDFRMLRLRSILPLVQTFALRNEITFGSCLDIGCGRGRYDKWFRSSRCAVEPRRYIGLDTDPVIVEELRAAGVDARDPLQDGGDLVSDLTLCVEVIEHLRPEESEEFFSYVADHTRKVVGLTTPDFEYWRGGNWRAIEGYTECRWIPDHAPTFDPGGGPHTHKQRMSPELLHTYLRDALDPQEWNFEVFRAWPWTFVDHAADRQFRLAFKIYALAWRRDCAAVKGLELDDVTWSDDADASKDPERDLYELKLQLAENEALGLSLHNQALAAELAATETLHRRVASLEDQHARLEELAATRGSALWDTSRALESAELELVELREQKTELEQAIERMQTELRGAEERAADLHAERRGLLEDLMQARRDRDLAVAGWGAAERARTRARQILGPDET